MSRGFEHHVPEGCKFTAKVKRGTDTRDQDTLKIEGRGETAEDAAEKFEESLTAAEEGNWVERLRELQAEESDEVTDS